MSRNGHNLYASECFDLDSAAPGAASAAHPTRRRYGPSILLAGLLISVPFAAPAYASVDLEVTMSEAPNTAYPGNQEVRAFTATVTNKGNESATNVALTISNLPSPLEKVADNRYPATCSHTSNGRIYAWAASLAPGASRHVTEFIDLKGARGTFPISAKVQANQTDANTANNSVSFALKAAAVECGAKVMLKSWKNDYLTRTTVAKGVDGSISSSPAGTSTMWTVVCQAGKSKVLLQSATGDYLHRPEAAVARAYDGTGIIGSEWDIEVVGDKFKLKSWKGDYLHRSDTASGVVMSNTGIGNEWTIQYYPCDKNIWLKSWKNDYLIRTTATRGYATSISTGSTSSSGVKWKVQCQTGKDKILLQSTLATLDFLHRPEQPELRAFDGPGIQGSEWVIEVAGGKLKLKSWKGDYLHRPDTAAGVVTSSAGTGNYWTIVTP